MIPPYGEGLLGALVRKRGGVTGGAGSLRPFFVFSGTTKAPRAFAGDVGRSSMWFAKFLILASPFGVPIKCKMARIPASPTRRPGHRPPSSSWRGSLMLPSSSCDHRLGRRSSSFVVHFVGIFEKVLCHVIPHYDRLAGGGGPQSPVIAADNHKGSTNMRTVNKFVW